MGTDDGGEAETWAAAKAGDSAAFARMFDLHRDRVFGQALRLIRTRHDAEDVTAVVFLEAWRKRDSVRVVDGSIIGWLLVTTAHTVQNSARSSRRYRAMLERLPAASAADEHPDHAADIDERLDREEQAVRMRAAFGRLSKADQDVVALCVLEELTTAEASRVLGVPVGTVKSRLSRARQRLSAHAAEALGSAANVSGGAK